MHLLWDFDGTIADTYPHYTAVFKETFPQFSNVEEIEVQLRKSFSEAFQYFQLTDAQIKQFKANVATIDSRKIDVFTGVKDIMAHVNLNVIMTHKEKSYVQRFLAQNNLAHFVAEIVTPEDGYPRKPHVASYAYLHRKYTLHAAIGDRELDLIPAKELGLVTCKFGTESAIANIIISDYQCFYTNFEQFVQLCEQKK